MRLTLDHADALRDVDRASGAVPALVTGRLRGTTVPAGTWLAVAVDGRVAATAQVRDDERGPGAFSALVPPDAYRSGDADLSLHRIAQRPDGAVVLHRLDAGATGGT